MATATPRRDHPAGNDTTTTRPASSSSTGLFAARRDLDRELAELQRRGLVKQRGGGFILTGAGYQELARRFPRKRKVRR